MCSYLDYANNTILVQKNLKNALNHPYNFKGHHLSIHCQFITFKLKKYTKNDGIWNLLSKTRRTNIAWVFLGVFSSCILILASNSLVSVLRRWITLPVLLGLGPALLWAPTWCFGSDLCKFVREMCHTCLWLSTLSILIISASVLLATYDPPAVSHGVGILRHLNPIF